MTPSTALDQTLMQSFAFHKAGELVKAEALYKAILQAEPEHFDALHMLGVVHLQTGRKEEALRLIDLAVTINPQAPIAFNNRGNALQSLDRYQDALASYDKALALKSDYDEALKNRADVLKALGRYDEALVFYGKALDINSRFAEAYNNRGILLQALGRFADALESFDRAVALKPGNAEALNNRGDALRMLLRHEEALASYKQALAVNPALVEALVNAGGTLRVLYRYEEALASYDKALAIAPQHTKALNNRGAILRDTLRHGEALESFDKALALKPDYIEALVNRGTALHELGREDDAIQSFDKALALEPSHAEAHWNKALALLTQGDLAAGWREYEWRWKCRDFKFPPRGFSQPQWQGGDLRGGTLLVWGEQGVGDEVLYSSMVGDLVDRGISVMWESDPRLVPLVRRSYPGARAIGRVTPPDPATRDPLIRAQISTASLGQHLRRDAGDFPTNRRGYLKADDARAQAYRKQLLGADKTRLIGVSWISKNPDFGAHKTSRLEDWAPIWQAAGGASRFIDLQYGDTAVERAAANLDLTHLNDLDLFNDIDGLAALIAACDLVITVSNTTAHLAGALGIPVWVMVPGGNGKLWYWGAERAGAPQTRSPWYPSAAIFKQTVLNAWDEVVARIAQKLAQPK